MNIAPIGSRGDRLKAWFTEKGVLVSCGCWNGSLVDFEARVKSTHGDNEHGVAYGAAIAFIRSIKGIRPKHGKPQKKKEASVGGTR